MVLDLQEILFGFMIVSPYYYFLLYQCIHVVMDIICISGLDGIKVHFLIDINNLLPVIDFVFNLVLI